MEYKPYEFCKECDGKCVHLNEAGYDVDMHLCALCKKYVADADDFMNVDVEILSK